MELYSFIQCDFVIHNLSCVCLLNAHSFWNSKYRAGNLIFGCQQKAAKNGSDYGIFAKSLWGIKVLRDKNVDYYYTLGKRVVVVGKFLQGAFLW